MRVVIVFRKCFKKVEEPIEGTARMSASKVLPVKLLGGLFHWKVQGVGHTHTHTNDRRRPTFFGLRWSGRASTASL